ncbi:hypothetical protein HDU87_005114 [Geranomyces variabilis]|uniref:Uncharacterized protein n=1 Tax=Geranomyces variabilis TaxID=109894 RepID=A0AAD5XQU1_9FUNG|nr:hypothetical protein HDU87_005114 [Geranomyces variabilis]
MAPTILAIHEQPALKCPFASDTQPATSFGSSAKCPFATSTSSNSSSASSTASRSSSSASSAYPTFAKLLRPLDEKNLVISAQDKALATALRSLYPTTPHYRTAPLITSFNWADVAKLLPADNNDNDNDNDTQLSSTWYIVAFRSVRRADANSTLLYNADAAAHEEARNSGGILSYWYGELAADRRCLAMCVWASRDWALRATGKKAHLKAMRLAGRMYESYTLERYWLHKDVGVEGFRIEQIL